MRARALVYVIAAGFPVPDVTTGALAAAVSARQIRALGEVAHIISLCAFVHISAARKPSSAVSCWTVAAAEATDLVRTVRQAVAPAVAEQTFIHVVFAVLSRPGRHALAAVLLRPGRAHAAVCTRRGLALVLLGPVIETALLRAFVLFVEDRGVGAIGCGSRQCAEQLARAVGPAELKPVAEVIGLAGSRTLL